MSSSIKRIVYDAIQLTGENKSIVGRDENTGEYEYDEAFEVVDVVKTFEALEMETDCDGSCSECKVTKQKFCESLQDLSERKDILQGDISEIEQIYKHYLSIFKH